MDVVGFVDTFCFNYNQILSILKKRFFDRYLLSKKLLRFCAQCCTLPLYQLDKSFHGCNLQPLPQSKQTLSKVILTATTNSDDGPTCLNFGNLQFQSEIIVL